MMKKYTGVFLLLCIGVCLAGCGRSAEAEVKNTTEAHTAENRPAETMQNCGTLGHMEGSWTETDADYVNAKQYFEMRCERCGEVIDEKSEKMETFHDGNWFLISPEDFIDRMQGKFKKYVVDGSLDTKGEIRDQSHVFLVGISGRELGHIALLNQEGEPNSAECDKFQIALGLVLDPNIEGAMVVAAIETLDPSLSSEEAAALGREIFANYNQTEPVRKNGLEYTLFQAKEGKGFTVSIG